MKVYSDISLSNFEAWSGGAETLNALTTKECDFVETVLEEMENAADEGERHAILQKAAAEKMKLWEEQ